MDFRIISLPPFKAAASEVSQDFDFSENGILGKFGRYFSAIELSPRDSFAPRDFLYYDEEHKGMRWIWALSDEMDDGGNDIIDFEGGYYITYVFKDGDQETNGLLYNEALKFIENSKIFKLDVRQNHYAMGHIITPQKIIDVQGFALMETFIPIKPAD